MVALIGAQDTEVDAAEAGSWAAVTTAGFALRVLPGDHFYLHADPAATVVELRRVLARCTPPRYVGHAFP